MGANVSYPTMNQSLAAQVIVNEMRVADVDGRSRWGRSRYFSDDIDPNALVVEACPPKLGRFETFNPIKVALFWSEVFMFHYPRGNGTAGNRRLQRLYMACYSLKAPLSRPRSQRSRAAHDLNVRAGEVWGQMTPIMKRAFVENFKSDGLHPEEEMQMHGNTVYALWLRDLVKGDGSNHWLTDLGVTMLRRIKGGGLRLDDLDIPEAEEPKAEEPKASHREKMEAIRTLKRIRILTDHGDPCEAIRQIEQLLRQEMK